MKRLGVNQKLDELFNRVLNKPEHENKIHRFGDYIFCFSSVTTLKQDKNKFIQFDGFCFAILHNFKTNWYSRLGASNQIQPSLTDMMKKFYGDDEDKTIFRKQFTAYLSYLDMNDKLGDCSAKKSAKSKI